MGWRNKADVQGFFRIPDTTSYVKINSLGYRDKERNLIKATNITRILVYADSFGWGYGVDQKNRFTDILEENIKSFEVWNMGVTGYGTDQEFLSYKAEGVFFDPDIVVVVMHSTDLRDMSDSQAYGYSRPYLTMSNSILQFKWPVESLNTNTNKVHRNLLDLTYTTTENSQVISQTLNLFLSIEYFRELIVEKIYKKNMHIRTLDETLPIFEEVMKEWNDLCFQNNVKLILVIIPDKTQIYANRKYPRVKEIKNICKKLSIPYIDAVTEFQKHSNEQLYFVIDGHFNDRGHELLAEILENYLKWIK